MYIIIITIIFILFLVVLFKNSIIIIADIDRKSSKLAHSFIETKPESVREVVDKTSKKKEKKVTQRNIEDKRLDTSDSLHNTNCHRNKANFKYSDQEDCRDTNDDQHSPSVYGMLTKQARVFLSTPHYSAAQKTKKVGYKI